MPSLMGTRALARPSSAPSEAAQRCTLRLRMDLCGSTVQHRWRCWGRCEGLTERRTQLTSLMQGLENHRTQAISPAERCALHVGNGGLRQQAFLPAGYAGISISDKGVGFVVALRSAGTGLASC